MCKQLWFPKLHSFNPAGYEYFRNNERVAVAAVLNVCLDLSFAFMIVCNQFKENPTPHPNTR